MSTPNPILPSGVLHATPGIHPAPGKSTARPAQGREFQQLLHQAIEQSGPTELKFSAHARQRLEDRNIQLNPADLQRLNAAADLAAHKGSRDALLLMDGLGMIVNIPSRTVITAMPTGTTADGIFTNIDSTVIV